MRYTVKQVSQLTGISRDSLRAWERRYEVVAPTRTASGYRLYDEDDVSRLRRMVDLIAGGALPSLAAEQVLADPASAPTGAPGPAPAPLSTGPFPPTDALTDAARALDRDAVDHALDAAFGTASFEYVFDEWLTPSLAHLGEAWACGRMDIAGEHFVSGAVHRRLSAAFDAAGAPSHAPTVVVGLPRGSLHEFAALGLATCLRRRGLDVRYLGRDLPETSWQVAVRQLVPAAVAIPVPLGDDVPAASELVRALAEATPRLRLFVGGRGCDGWEVEQPVTALRTTVPRAAREMADLLTS